MGILNRYEKEYQKVQVENKDDFVTNVACAREVEVCILPSSSRNNIKNNISSPRTSNKCNKLADCDSCPAGGLWDHLGPGKYCFHSAYFLGKSGKPMHCKSAQHDCPLKKAK